jgi:hypothetical protein
LPSFSSGSRIKSIKSFSVGVGISIGEGDLLVFLGLFFAFSWRSSFNFLGSSVDALRSFPSTAQLSGTCQNVARRLKLFLDDGPPMQEQRTLTEKPPLTPSTFKENYYHALLHKSQPFVRHVFHLSIAGDDDFAASLSKSPDPRGVVILLIVVVAALGGVVGSTLNHMLAKLFLQLPFFGKSLEDSNQGERDVLVKGYL